LFPFYFICAGSFTTNGSAIHSAVFSHLDDDDDDDDDAPCLRAMRGKDITIFIIIITITCVLSAYSVARGKSYYRMALPYQFRAVIATIN